MKIKHESTMNINYFAKSLMKKNTQHKLFGEKKNKPRITSASRCSRTFIICIHFSYWNCNLTVTRRFFFKICTPSKLHAKIITIKRTYADLFFLKVDIFFLFIVHVKRPRSCITWESHIHTQKLNGKESFG